MSELPGVLAVAADNSAGVFGLSADTLAILFFALNQIENYEYWKDYPDEILSDADRDEIDRLVGVATYEVMNMVNVIPVGTVQMWPTNTPPTDWMVCDGASLLRADYAELFAIIGTIYGAVDGTHFNLPDMRDRSPMGVGGFIALGGFLGAATHTLNSGENGVHSHLVTDPGHAHLQQIGGVAAYLGTGGTGRTAYGAVTTSNTTRVTSDGQTTGISIQNSAGGNPHNNVHPVMGINYIIYSGG
jgi:microcystin-dependent protein